MAKVTWEEKARISVSDKTDVVISFMVENMIVKGVVVSKFVEDIGFCKGGPFIPLKKVQSLIDALQEIADEFK